MANHDAETSNFELQSKNSLIINNAKFALTTIDNPYNPFSQFSDWLMFDNLHGYGTSQYLARIAKTSEALSIQENDDEIEWAIDEIIKNDFLGIYKKVKNDSYKIEFNE